MPERTPPPDPAQIASHLAATIRRRRLEAGLTLDELAQRSGVSRAMLSEVERGRKSPTIRVVCQIAAGLECTVSDLLDEPPATNVTVLRRQERSRFIDTASGVERHVLSTTLGSRSLEVVWYVIPAGRETGEFPPHRPGVVELVTVVAGKLELRLGGERFVLEEGDSASYSADVIHQYRALSRRKCELLLLIDSSALSRTAAPSR